MDTNTTVTLYLPSGGGWKRVESPAFWAEERRIASSKQEVAQRRGGTVFLPLSVAADIPERSYLVRGIVPEVTGEADFVKKLIRDHAAQMILRAVKYDFGGLPHWELEVGA